MLFLGSQSQFVYCFKAHEVVSACGVSANVAQHHVSWTGSIARHWLCLWFCAVLAESNKLKTCYVIWISWNTTCCKNSPGSRHYTLGWVPSLDSGKQSHSRIQLMHVWSMKKKRWKTWNLRLPDKAEATVHRLPCMVLANSGSWRGGKVQVKSDEGYDFDDLANPFTVSVLVLFWIIRANLECKERNTHIIIFTTNLST